MTRDRIGNVPYEIRKKGDKINLRFYPKTDTAKNPDKIVFVLSLDKSDRKKLASLVS
jgi:hypothetical protein